MYPSTCIQTRCIAGVFSYTDDKNPGGLGGENASRDPASFEAEGGTGKSTGHQRRQPG